MKKNRLYVWILLVVLLGGVVYMLDRNNVSIPEAVFGNTTTIAIEGLRFQVEIADSPSERRKGLSGRDNLAGVKGLLFIFPESDYHGIWMKDMRFPIDVIWINEDFHIVDITYNLTPESYPESFTPKEPARYILETNVGFSREYDVQIGDAVTIPDRFVQ